MNPLLQNIFQKNNYESLELNLALASFRNFPFLCLEAASQSALFQLVWVCICTNSPETLIDTRLDFQQQQKYKFYRGKVFHNESEKCIQYCCADCRVIF